MNGYENLWYSCIDPISLQLHAEIVTNFWQKAYLAYEKMNLNLDFN